MQWSWRSCRKSKAYKWSGVAANFATEKQIEAQEELA
jgi:hypothetical protein